MKKNQNILSSLAILIAFTVSNAQSTYVIGNTEYISGEYYTTTGKPKVVRSEANKRSFLRSQGYSKTPYGYHIDHITPLSQGGTDSPSNMQLLTVRQHKAKTARERSNSSNSYYYKDHKSSNYYYVKPLINLKKVKYQRSSYNTSSSARAVYIGSRGGNYYINSNGNKTYVKK